MRIKFGRMWGNSLTLSHSEKKARRTTDLVASVNHNSWLDRGDQRTSYGHLSRHTNQVIFVVFNALMITGKHCARLVRTISIFASHRLHGVERLALTRRGALTES
ncbi:hypothetical protein A5906_16360 [Bradyrhizobium sacchari]|uniref:Uncharacterized protein n=1 Tax=Bradyrhizobium sacchari TaxID=1399419 RepID=A0A560K963_9BRAD|nr:hypothetical protein A5906_16360 [Bradyrhizobium sacchari]TWB53926.1 hypothetical protein FBZ94_108208 [Bradyrhizobium sacchari]TWB78374.1 hypothetical protein FBZ95_103208 [Bradyrhizobium sacchari]